MTTSVRHPRPAGEPRTAAASPARRRGRTRRRERYLSLNGAMMVGLAALALGVIAILYLVQTSQVAELGYQLSYLQKQEDQLNDQNALLSYQDAQAHAMNVIDQIAVGQLGMVPMHSYQYITVQRPAQTELPPVPAEPQVHVSLLTRLQDALSGTSRSAHPTETPVASPTVANPNGSNP